MAHKAYFPEPKSFIGRAFNIMEETLIALCLGAMTLVTFANVVARYVFNDNILWALELTGFLFAWLILMGASYGVKKHFHIGVDVVINLFSHTGKKICALFAVLICITFSFMLLYGAWEYWYPFIIPESTELAPNVYGQGFYEVEEVPMVGFLQFFSQWTNDSNSYEKLPRFIAYFALPFGTCLLTYRFLQQGWYIITNRTNVLVAGHEAEEGDILVEQLDYQNSISENDSTANNFKSS